ncbi:MAG: hypothetical protein Q7R78_00005, partial [bacterium]|nr:hypothetical protein [bacterium]
VIPIGTRTIIRKFSEKNKKSHHLAASEISMYASGALVNTINDSSSEDVQNLHREWSTGVSSSIENISIQPNIPSKICVTADMAMEKAFGNLVRKEVIKTLGISEESTEIFNIGDMNLSKYISNESSGVTDDILLLCVLGIHKVKRSI